MQRGVAQWSATETYPEGAIVQHNGIMYRADVENEGRAPDGSPGHWGAPWAPTVAGDDRSHRVVNTELLAKALGTMQPVLDFTPVQQGTGMDQGGNVVKIGWAKDGSGLLVSVDNTNLGAVAFAKQLAAYVTQEWVKGYAVSKAGDTMTGDLSIKRSDDNAKGFLMKRPDGTSQFWLHAAKGYVSLAVMNADGSWRENVLTVRESDFFTTIVGGLSVGSLASVNDLNWGNAGARTAFDGNIWGIRWSTDGKGSPNWLSEWVSALVNGRADWNAVNGKANAGARVQWDSGVNNFGSIERLNGALPAPWVVCGLAGPGNGTANAIAVLGVVLRNQ